MPGRRELARLCGLGTEGAGFVKTRHGKHDLPPGDATDDTAMLLQAAVTSYVSSIQAHIPYSRLPTRSFLWWNEIPIWKLLRPWPALPAHLLQMPAFVGWRRLAAPDRFGASTKPLLLVLVR